MYLSLFQIDSMQFIDQLNRQIFLEQTPKRVVCLVPSITELLADLGLNEEVLGITKFCVFPEHWQSSKRIVGGTKTIHVDRVKSLTPDIIIANKEENIKEQIEQLEQMFPVWISDVKSVEDNYDLINRLGLIFNRKKEADEIISKTKRAFLNLKRPDKSNRVLYMIWRRPFMAAGSDTFIHAILDSIGFENCLKDKNRYPGLSEEDIKKLNPDRVFLSSEPYPFGEKHRDEIQKIVPDAQVQLVDGTLFSWYGSRMQKVELLNDLF